MNHFGYYGKIRHKGDFVRYNLPQSFVNIWDDWLLQLMVNGEEKHGENWSSIYSKTETYRFVLSRNIAGDDAWAGLLFASTDKVGRRFPFCFAAALPEEAIPLVGDNSGDSFLEPWFVEVEQLALASQQEQFDFGALQENMATLNSSFMARREVSEYSKFRPGVSDGNGQVAVVSNSSTLLHSRSGYANLTHAMLCQSLFHYSLWVTSGNTAGGTTMLTNGLPTGNLGLALFDRDWNGSGSGILESSELDMLNTQQITASDTYIPTANAIPPVAGVAQTIEVPQPEDQTIPEDDTTRETSAIAPKGDAEPATQSLSTSEPAEPVTDDAVTEDSSTEQESFNNSNEFVTKPKVEPLEIEDDSTNNPWEN